MSKPPPPPVAGTNRAGHAHAALLQASPPLHSTPQSPQLSSSLLTGMQSVPHVFIGAEHTAASICFGASIGISAASIGTAASSPQAANAEKARSRTAGLSI